MNQTKQHKKEWSRYYPWMNFHKRMLPQCTSKELTPDLLYTWYSTFERFDFSLDELEAATQRLVATDPDCYPRNQLSRLIDIIQMELRETVSAHSTGLLAVYKQWESEYEARHKPDFDSMTCDLDLDSVESLLGGNKFLIARYHKGCKLVREYANGLI